jgi:carboxyl-terminal processing protease
MLDDEKKIGYVRLTSFVENSVPDVRKALEALEKDKMKALILDLRFDPGGILKGAVEMADLFLSEGVIVKTKGRTTPYWEATATKAGTLPYFPMVVLINQFSASASEIVSGALQDHHRAIIIGERTFGKGSVQNVIPLRGEESALKLTTSKYYLPSGRNIHRDEDMKDDDEWGVVPDIVVPMTPLEYVGIIRARQDADVIHDNGDKEPKGEPSKIDEPEKDKPGAEKPKSESKPPESDKKGDESAPPDAAPGAPPETKPATPVVDRQLQRALDVLRSMDVIEKYLKKAA